MLSADLQIVNSGTASFTANDVDSNGNLWVGDKDFNIYKSIDNGSTFKVAWTLPKLLDRTNVYAGLVWTVFVDSRNHIFMSAGGTNALYRSTNDGATFSEVLNTNGARFESFFVAVTEDDLGHLYTAVYTNGTITQPAVYKSTDAGATWTKIASFNVLHYHNIKYNPANGYLYLVTGEGNYPDAARVFRSKDRGATWSLVVSRNDALGTVYLGIAFVGNYVYLGQDYPNRVCQIHRFYDNGSNSTFAPQVVYTPPSDGYMPFISATVMANTLVFANCGENFNGVSRVVTSTDGVNWKVIRAQYINYVTDNRWNFLTESPRSGIIFGTIKTGENYQIRDVSPTPTPSPSPTPSPTPAPTPTSTPSPTPTPTPSSTPQPTEPPPTPTATPTPTPSPTPTPEPTASPIPQTLNNSPTEPPLIKQTPKPTASPLPSPTQPVSSPSLSPSPTVVPVRPGVFFVGEWGLVVLWVVVVVLGVLAVYFVWRRRFL